MRKLLSYSFFLLFVAMICSCSDDNDIITNYFTNEANVTRIADGFKGSFEGKVTIVLSSDYNSKVYIPDSIWKGKWTDEVDSHPILRYTLGGKDDMNLTVQQFPVSAVGYVVNDSLVAKALKNVPNTNLVFPYKFYPSDEYTDENLLGVIRFENDTLSMSLNYGGTQHQVAIVFSVPMGTRFDGAKGPYLLSRIQLRVTRLYIDGKLEQSFTTTSTPRSYFGLVIADDNDGHEIVEEGTQTKDDI